MMMEKRKIPNHTHIYLHNKNSVYGSMESQGGMFLCTGKWSGGAMADINGADIAKRCGNEQEHGQTMEYRIICGKKVEPKGDRLGL
ncbi:MAG: hypothetical protein M3O22_07400 [Pseudomonadota bacterium]|nr:hypothetical protein [Pseudomonadota bacterium]